MGIGDMALLLAFLVLLLTGVCVQRVKIDITVNTGGVQNFSSKTMYYYCNRPFCWAWKDSSNVRGLDNS